MGVSVRVSRNMRVYLPFWIAIPAYVLLGAIYLVIIAVWVLWIQLVMSAGVNLAQAT